MKLKPSTRQRNGRTVPAWQEAPPRLRASDLNYPQKEKLGFFKKVFGGKA